MLTISLFRSELRKQSETIIIDEKEKALKECLDIDFEYAIISVNGNIVDKNYVLKEGDVCSVRMTSGVITSIVATAVLIGSAIDGKTPVDFVKNKLQEWLLPKPDEPTNDPTTTRSSLENIPNLQGAKNQSAFGKVVPIVLGRSFFTPEYCGKPYRVISGTDGEKQTFYCLYMLGYKDLLPKDIKLGMTDLTTNPNNRETGVFTNPEINGRWDASEYNIGLEIVQGTESTIYPSKVSEEQLNIQLVNVSPHLKVYNPITRTWDDRAGDYLITNRFSSKYPKTIEVEFTLQGLIGYSTSGSEMDESVYISIEISFNGGSTYQPFAQITGSNEYYSSATEVDILYNSLKLVIPQGTSKITRKKNKVMRFVARRNLTENEARSCVNGVAELRISKVYPKDDSDYGDQSSVWLSGIRTWVYDPNSSSYVNQRPLDSVRTQNTARLAVRFEANETDFKNQLDSLNCILNAKARTFSNGDWSNTKSVTSNPASMMLMLLEHSSRGRYAYNDNDIDMANLGEFYEWCNQPRSQNDNTPKFQCNGVVTSKKKTKELIDAVLACGRGKLLLDGKKFAVWIDKPRNVPVMVLNNQNVLSANNRKSLDDLPDGYKAKFLNEQTWQMDEWDIVINPNAPVNPVFESSELLFHTNPKQVYQQMMYLYACQKLRPEVWNLKVSVDGNLLDIGSLIEYQSDTLSVGIGDGAEIKDLVIEEGYITRIITDGNMYIDDLTQEYGISITCADGVNEPKVMTYKVVPAETGEQSVFVLDAPILESTQYKPNVGDIVSFGFLNRITTKALCFGKKDNGDGTFDLTLVPYQEGVYTADSGEIPEYITNVSDIPQRDQGSYEIDKSSEVANRRFNEIVEGGADIGEPDEPSDVVAKAEENGIQIKWTPVEDNGLSNAVKDYAVEVSRDDGETWIPLGTTFNSDYMYVFKRTASEPPVTGEYVDGYPEASAFSTWKFRVKAESIYGKSSDYVVTELIDTSDYGTWIVPNFTVQTEVVDRTAILTAVYVGTVPPKIYGHNKLSVWISRQGNTDTEGGRTFNDILGVTPDVQNNVRVWYTPEFSLSVMPSDTEDTEKNYHHFKEVSGQTVADTDAFITDSYKVSHTLPLIGQCPRLYNGNTYVTFACNAEDTAEVPLNPQANDVIHYTGATGTLESGKYYIYLNDSWVELTYKKPTIVPTEYYYKITISNESGSSKTVDDTSILALCTNIADIVHSHEHYKDLYVEKLSAISANIGLISQGGMGSFEDMLNCWALSDLSPEDSGTLEGVKKGTFRVGGANEYFRVTPQGNGKYKIELRAGNIELTTDVDGQNAMDFQSGTYIYNNDKTARLQLSAEGITAQKQIVSDIEPVGTENPADLGWYVLVNGKYERTTDTSVVQGRNYYMLKWENVTKVYSDEKGNMIITNADNDKVPPFGFTVTGTIYHLDDPMNPLDEEVAEGVTPSNPQNLSATGTLKPTTEDMIVYKDCSPYYLDGTVSKTDMASFNGNVVFMSKSDKVMISDLAVDINGDVEIYKNADYYNECLTSEKGQTTLGDYIGLSSSQISNGIFSAIN